MAVNGDTTYLLDTYELELIKNKHIEIETKPLGQNLLVNLQTPFGVPIEKQCVKGGVLNRSAQRVSWIFKKGTNSNALSRISI